MYKIRAQASEACKKGRVSVGAQRIKPQCFAEITESFSAEGRRISIMKIVVSLIYGPSE